MPEIAGIHYRGHRGDSSIRTPIILIHGAGIDSRIWPFQLRRLEDYSVYIIDLPGHGRSQGVCCHSVSSYVDTLINFLNHLEINRAVFVGLGIGGNIIMELSERFPDRVRGVFLINTGLQYDIPRSASMPLSGEQSSSAFQRIIFYGTAGDRWNPFLQQLGTIIQSQRQSVLIADIFLMEQYHYPYQQIHPENIPVRCLFCERDRLLGKGYLDVMQRFINQDHLIAPVSGRSHWLPLEDPLVVKSHLLAFIHELQIN